MTNWPDCPVEPLAAPVLRGERYHKKPIYFSDVVVRRDSLYTSFGDLRRCVWAYNEYVSHSGYNLVCYSLLERGEALPFFSKTMWDRINTFVYSKSLAKFRIEISELENSGILGAAGLYYNSRK